MSVTCGFYNSLNGDRKYNAIQMGRIFDGLIGDGVFATVGNAFVVKAANGNTVNKTVLFKQIHSFNGLFVCSVAAAEIVALLCSLNAQSKGEIADLFHLFAKRLIN